MYVQIQKKLDLFQNFCDFRENLSPNEKVSNTASPTLFVCVWKKIVKLEVIYLLIDPDQFEGKMAATRRKVIPNSKYFNDEFKTLNIQRKETVRNVRSASNGKSEKMVSET